MLVGWQDLVLIVAAPSHFLPFFLTIHSQRDCTVRVAKTEALISFADTAHLICVFVFAYAKSRFSHNEAQFINV